MIRLRIIGFILIAVGLILIIVSDARAETATDTVNAPYAKKQAKIAKTERTKLIVLTRAFSLHDPKPMPSLLNFQTWKDYGDECKRMAGVWKSKRDRLYYKAKHPGGSGAARWWPLAKYVGWKDAQRSDIIRIIRRESDGNPNCYTPPYGAAGLLQFIKPWWTGSWGLPAFNPYNPERNLSMGLRLWKRQGGSFLPAWALTY